jgi:cation transport protein ChaC
VESGHRASAFRRAGSAPRRAWWPFKDAILLADSRWIKSLRVVTERPETRQSPVCQLAHGRANPACQQRPPPIVATQATHSFRSADFFLRRARSYCSLIFLRARFRPLRAMHHHGAYRMLNRNAIRSGAYLESFDSLPAEMLWSQARIDASLAQTLQQRPDDGDVWVFAYGSLMWNPISEFDSRRIATLPGWHRSFCIRLIAGRGTPEQPGRMLALEPGGGTHGVALRLCGATVDEELRILWIREMVTGAYRPIWAPVTLDDGTEVSALAFVAEPEDAQYEGDSRASAIAPSMAVANGLFGTNADYVFKLQRALTDCGLTDPYIDELAFELTQISSQPA